MRRVAAYPVAVGALVLTTLAGCSSSDTPRASGTASGANRANGAAATAVVHTAFKDYGAFRIRRHGVSHVVRKRSVQIRIEPRCGGPQCQGTWNIGLAYTFDKRRNSVSPWYRFNRDGGRPWAPAGVVPLVPQFLPFGGSDSSHLVLPNGSGGPEVILDDAAADRLSAESSMTVGRFAPDGSGNLTGPTTAVRTRIVAAGDGSARYRWSDLSTGLTCTGPVLPWVPGTELTRPVHEGELVAERYQPGGDCRVDRRP